MRFHRSSVLALLAALTGGGLALGHAASTGATASAAACSAAVPADLTKRPARWLGKCAGGRAEGPGVLRLGTGEPYQFFLGTMKAGRPARGVLKVNGSQLVAAYAFDPGLAAVVPDGNRPGELDAVFQAGSAGATATARRFAAAGNRASAAYYARLAKQYREPPFE